MREYNKIKTETVSITFRTTEKAERAAGLIPLTGIIIQTDRLVVVKLSELQKALELLVDDGFEVPVVMFQ